MIITEFVKTGEKEDLIRLSDGKNSAWFEFIEMTVYNNNEYAALLQQGEDVPVVMKLYENKNDGKEYYFTVDDDIEFETVLNLLELQMEDE